MITDLRSFLKVSCHTKFRSAEREAQCILGECAPLMAFYIVGPKCVQPVKEHHALDFNENGAVP